MNWQSILLNRPHGTGKGKGKQKENEDVILSRERAVHGPRKPKTFGGPSSAQCIVIR